MAVWVPVTKIYKSGIANGYQLLLVITVVSQNIRDNTSLIQYTLSILAKNVTYSNQRIIANVMINGAWRYQVYDVSRSGPQVGLSLQIVTGTLTATHVVNKGTLGMTFAANYQTIVQSVPSGTTNWTIPPLGISGNFSLPEINQVPEAPGVPLVSENAVTGIMMITSKTAVRRASAITGYQVQVRDNYKRDEWVVFGANVSRVLYLPPTKPVTTYEYQTRAVSNGGVGDWSESTFFTGTGHGPQVLVNGLWKDSDTYINVQGNWTAAECYTKHNNIWKKTTRRLD